MNKKGAGGSSGFFQFMFNAALVSVVIYFIFTMLFGAGGGFSAVFKAGGALNKLFNVLPWWGIVIFVLFVFYLFFGGKK